MGEHIPLLPSSSQKSTLWAACGLYTIAAANEYWLVGWLASLYGVRLPIFAALLQNASWPIQIIYYRYERSIESEKRIITPSMLRSYTILGCLSAFITLTRTIGLTSLPPPVYVICANSEIVFESWMTCVILRRPVSQLQLAAVVCVLVGVVITLYNPHSQQFGDSAAVSRSALLIGVTVSLLSRFASSLNTILAEQFLGVDAKSHFGVLECALANSLIPSLLLPFTLLLTPEYIHWNILTSYPPSATAIIALLCIGVTLSKHLDRLCKFRIVSMSSTLFFAAVDSNMKVVAGIGSFLFFKDPIFWPQIVGFLFIFVSLALMYVDKKRRLQKSAVQFSRVEVVDTDAADAIEICEREMIQNHM